MAIKKYYVERVSTYDEVKKKEGKYFKSFGTVIDHDADVYFKDLDQWKLLISLRKGVIPDNYMTIALDSFKEEAKKASSIRGKAGGEVDPKKIGGKVTKVVSGKFRSRVEYSDGRISDYYMSNKVNSMIVGYFDKPKLSEKHAVVTEGKVPCRTTAFTEKFVDKWKETLPLFKLCDELYSDIMPENHKEQLSLASKTPQFQIGKTAFSTVTVNYNWQTANHTDHGDYHNGYSVVLVAKEGEYTGGYLGYPEFDVAVDVSHGDFALMNPHKWHANTPINGKNGEYTRLSMVMYYRENILNCQTRVPLKLKLLPLTVNDVEIKCNIRKNTTDIKVIKEVLETRVYHKTTRDKDFTFDVEKGEKWLDLGGNIGTFAIYALTKGAKKVISYEPEKDNFEILSKNMLENFPKSKYSIVESAVGTISGKTNLYL